MRSFSKSEAWWFLPPIEKKALAEARKSGKYLNGARDAFYFYRLSVGNSEFPSASEFEGTDYIGEVQDIAKSRWKGMVSSWWNNMPFVGDSSAYF